MLYLEVLIKDDNTLYGIFFQDKQYPELLCIDATYKLLEFLYISSMVAAFKKYNPKWEAVRVLMAERLVFAAGFPQAQLLIYLSNISKGDSSGQRTMILEMLQQMAYGTSDESYYQITICYSVLQ